MKTALELIEEFKKNDAEMVEAFNGQFWGGPPPLEAQVEFLRRRLLLTSSALYLFARTLLDERGSGDNGGRDA